MPSRNGEDASETVVASLGSPEKELTSPRSSVGDSDITQPRVTRSSSRLRGAKGTDVVSATGRRIEKGDSGKRKVTSRTLVGADDAENLDVSLPDSGEITPSSSRGTRQNTASHEKGGKKKVASRKRAKTSTEGELPSADVNINMEVDEIDDPDLADENEEINAPVNGATDSPSQKSQGSTAQENEADQVKNGYLDEGNDELNIENDTVHASNGETVQKSDSDASGTQSTGHSDPIPQESEKSDFPGGESIKETQVERAPSAQRIVATSVASEGLPGDDIQRTLREQAMRSMLIKKQQQGQARQTQVSELGSVHGTLEVPPSGISGPLENQTSSALASELMQKALEVPESAFSGGPAHQPASMLGMRKEQLIVEEHIVSCTQEVCASQQSISDAADKRAQAALSTCLAETTENDSAELEGASSAGPLVAPPILMTDDPLAPMRSSADQSKAGSSHVASCEGPLVSSQITVLESQAPAAAAHVQGVPIQIPSNRAPVISPVENAPSPAGDVGHEEDRAVMDGGSGQGPAPGTVQPGTDLEPAARDEEPAAAIIISSIDDFLTDQRRRIEASAPGESRPAGHAAAGAPGAEAGDAPPPYARAVRSKRGGAVGFGGSRHRNASQRMAAGPADPSLIVTFGSDSDGSDEDASNGSGLSDNPRSVASRNTAVASSTAATSTAISAGSATLAGVSKNSSGVPPAKAAADAGRAGLSKPVVVGPDGVALTPGRAASALEKRIALLKRKIQQKTSKTASAPLPAVGASPAPAVGASVQPASFTPVTPSVTAAQPPVSAVVPQPIGVSTAAPSGQGLRNEDVQSAVGAKRQRSPALLSNSSSDARRRSPAADNANVTVASQSASTTVAAPAAHAQISTSTHSAPAHNPALASGFAGGPEAVFTAQLRLEGRSRSPAVEAESPNGRPQVPVDLRRRSPTVIASGAAPLAAGPQSAEPDSSSRLAENQELEARRRAAASVALISAAAARPARQEAVRIYCECSLRIVETDAEIDGQQVRPGRPVSGERNSMDTDGEGIVTLADSSLRGSGTMVLAASASRVYPEHTDGYDEVTGGGLLSNAESAAASADLPALAAAFAGPALSVESLQRAKEIAERRLRGVRRLMEENLREDLELQMQIQQLESSIAEQQQVVMAAQDLLNQELILLAEADE